MGTGYDNVDVEATGKAGIPVANVPEFCTNEVADHTFGNAAGLCEATV
jgi:D-3-phosphoglycerate dehydrogenase / 2-oxoglutarate reductase